MPAKFTFYERHDDRLEMPIFRTSIPNIDRKFIDEKREIFCRGGSIKRYIPGTIIRDESGTLEIFNASGSIWWSKILNKKSESRNSIHLLKDEIAISEADSYLKKVKLDDNDAKPVLVTLNKTIFQKSKNENPEEVISRQHVNYKFWVNNFPVWGPGAKIRVTFGHQKEIIEVYKFWRNLKQGSEYENDKFKIIDTPRAIEIFKSNKAFADLSEQTAEVKVSEIDIGYYAMPPREVQPCLIPVYRFTGFVLTKRLGRYDFNKYVVATDVTNTQLKKDRIILTALPTVI